MKHSLTCYWINFVINVYRCGRNQQCCDTPSRKCCSIPTVYRDMADSWYIWLVSLSNISKPVVQIVLIYFVKVFMRLFICYGRLSLYNSLWLALSANGKETCCKMIQDPRKNPDCHQNLIDLSLDLARPLQKFHQNPVIPFWEILFTGNDRTHRGRHTGRQKDTQSHTHTHARE